LDWERYILIRVPLPLLVLLVLTGYLIDAFTAYLVFLKDPSFFFEREQNWFFKESLRTGNWWLEGINWLIFLSFVLSLLKSPIDERLKKISLQSCLFIQGSAVSGNVLYGLLRQELLSGYIESITFGLALYPILHLVLWKINPFKRRSRN
jgi:hypothetical protein